MSSTLTKFNSRKTALVAGCTAHAVQDGLIAATYVLLPVLAQTFGFSYTQVGLIKGLKSLAQALLEMYSGLVSERIGEGLTLVFGLILAGIGYALLSGAPDTALVMACLLVVGAGSGFQHAPASALVSAAYASGGRRGALGLYNSAGDIGKLAFSACFSLGIGAGMAWQRIAFSYGVVALVAAIAIAVALRVFERQPRAQDADTSPNGTDPRLGWGILDRRAFTVLIVVVFLDTVVQTSILVFVAFLMIAKGLPLYIATLGAVAVLTGGIFGKAGCGFLAERIGVRRAFILVQVLTAVGLAAVVAAPGWLAFALLGPLGVVAQGSTSITYGLVPDMIHPSRLARGYALMYASTSFASAGGPLAFGHIGDTFGIGASMLVMAVVAMLAVPPVLMLRFAARPGHP